MAIPFKSPIDLEKNELQNARIQNLSADPANPVKGQIYFNTTANKFRCYNGTAWEDYEPAFTKNTAFNKDFGTVAGTVCQGNDSRLSDNRTPKAHAATHVTGGGDVIADAVADGNAGLMTGADKSKLDGIEAQANKYIHPTTAGNKHVPELGATNQVLVYGAASGVAIWADMSDAIHGDRGGGALHAAATTTVAGFMSSVDKTKLDNATDAATANRLMIRDASGRAKVATPSAEGDIATKGYVDSILNVNDAIVFKGVINCSTNPNYPAADAGHTYVVSVAGKIGGASGVNVEAGDKLMCLVDGTAAGTHATVGANWNISQANIDGAVIGPASAVDGRIAVFDGTSGKLIKDSGKKLGDYLPLAGGVMQGNIAFSEARSHGLIGFNMSYLQFAKLGEIEVCGHLKPFEDAGSGLGNEFCAWSGIFVNQIYINKVRKDLNWDAAYTHSKATSGNPHSVSKADIGVGGGAVSIGDGIATEFTITHNMNSRDLVVLVRSSSTPYEQVYVDVEFDQLNSFKVRFAAAPAADAYRVIWHKI